MTGPLSRRATVYVAAITKQDIIDRMAVEFDLTKVRAYVIPCFLPLIHMNLLRRSA